MFAARATSQIELLLPTLSESCVGSILTQLKLRSLGLKLSKKTECLGLLRNASFEMLFRAGCAVERGK